MQICFVFYRLELDFCVDDLPGVYLFSLSCCQLSIFLANESNFISLHLLAGLNTDKELNILFWVRISERIEMLFISHKSVLVLVHDTINLWRLCVCRGQGRPLRIATSHPENTRA